MLIPRLTDIEIALRLKTEFPNQVKFIKDILEYTLDENKNLKQNGNCFLQSFSIVERRLYTMIAAITPIIKGKKGVILSNRWDELEFLETFLVQRFPGLKVKLISTGLVDRHWDWVYNKYWDGKDPPDDFTSYDLLLCELRSFLRLKWDLKGIATNIRAICFHEVIPSDWYYGELIALVLKLRLSSRQFPLPIFFSSISDLPHIRVGDLRSDDALPEFQEDISWSAVTIPAAEFTLYNSMLANTILKLLQREVIENDGEKTSKRKASILLFTDNKDLSFYCELISEEWDSVSSRFEVISPNRPPEIVETADILMVEDVLLYPQISLKEAKRLYNKITGVLEHLKDGGEVVFFSPRKWVRGDELWLSGLFRLKFSHAQKKQLLLTLHFHQCLLEGEMVKVTTKSLDESLIHLSIPKLRSFLTGLTRYKLMEKIRGRYTCTHRDKKTHRPDGRTNVRYRGLLEHQIQHLISELEGDQIDSERAFQLAGIKARRLVKLLKYCPKVENLRELVQHASRFISKEKLEFELTYHLTDYTYALSNFSRVNPAWEMYDPRKKTPQNPPEAKDRPEVQSPYSRPKPAGRKGSGDRRSREERKKAILRLIRYREEETQQPVYWEEIMWELGIPRSSGFRIILKLIEEGTLKEIPRKKDAKSKPYFLEPKYLTEKNELGVRGRPRKLVVTSKFALPSLDKRTCGRCCHFHVRRCGVISDLIQMGMPEYIPYREIRALIHQKNLTNLDISPRLLGCKYFKKRKRDYHLKSLKIRPLTEIDTEEGSITELEMYVCAECGHDMDYSPHPRTIKCPNCHTKYTWKRKGNQLPIKVNVDYNHTQNEVLRNICGISKEVLPEADDLDADMSTRTKRYRTRAAQKRDKWRRNHPLILLGTIFRFLFVYLKSDFPLRQNLASKYGTPAFYTKRLYAILMSYTLATREFKTLRRYNEFQDIAEWEIDAHVFVQIEQIRKLFQPTKENPNILQTPTLDQFQTAERVIAKQCWQVNKLFLDRLEFYISNRKLLRYVNEFLEQLFRGSKGYTPANTLINCTHKICYEKTRKLLLDNGYGWECPGGAEHTHSKIGVVLDLSDPLKIAYRIALVKAIVEKQITEADFYSRDGRHHREIHLMKVESVRKLERIMKATNQKIIYPVTSGSEHNIQEGIPLWEVFEQSVKQLAYDLKHSDELSSTFIYAPIKEDYTFVADILKDYDIPLPSVPQTPSI